MKRFFAALIALSFSLLVSAQDDAYTNFISCKVDGKEFKAEARRMKIPVSGFEYHAIAAFQVSPDVQVWIRLYYFTDSLKSGTYQVISEDDLNKAGKKKADADLVWAMIDYTEETKGLGHAFHDGESLSGTITVNKIGNKTIEGTFEATLTGVYYKKRGLATVSGSGITGNLQKKAFTKAGGGMLVSGGAHDHENTKKMDETDTITLTDGKFFFDWNKTEK